MKQIILILIVYVGICQLPVQIANAQDTKMVQVGGYVTDMETGERLSDAHVSIGTQRALTNSYGFYSVRIPADIQLVTVTYMGYLAYTSTIDFRVDTVFSVALKSGVELSEVVISQSKIGNVETKGLGNIRVNLSQLAVSPLFLGERDIIKTMQFLPGVSSGMEGSSNLNIRGGTNDQTLYLMDDAPVYNQNHTFGFLSIFNADALLNADLYKGGLPAVYGNRLSGVANISLKDGNMKSHRQSISIGLLAGTLSAEGPVIEDKVSYLFTARRSFLDLLARGVLYVAMGDEMMAPDLSFWDVNGKITWKMSDKTRLSLSLYNGNDNIGVINRTKDHETKNVLKEKIGLGWKTTTASMRLTSSLRPNTYLSSSLYFSYLDNYNRYDVNDNYMKLVQRRSSSMHEIGWRTSIEKKLSNNQTLFAGFDASTQYYNPEQMVMEDNHAVNKFNDGTKKLLTATVFAYDELKWRNWVIVPGIRLSYYQTDRKEKIAVEPRLKLSTFINDDNRLMLAYDRTTQPVHSINEMNYTIQTDYWLPFSEDRLPTANQLSAGWKNFSFRNLTFSVETYYKTLNNLIQIRNFENYMDFQTDFLTGTGRSMGIEWMVQYERERFNTWLSYTLSKSERTFGNRTVPFKYDAPHDLSLFAGYIVKKKENLKNTISINMQYRSGFPYYVSELSYPIMPHPDFLINTWNYKDADYFPYYPNTRIKDFFRIDLNFTTEKKMKRGARIWQFSLLNATGHQNPYNIYRKNEKYKAFILIPFLPSFSYTRTF